MQVSVIVPCYNHAHFLAECLDSLLVQRFTEWEAIIVDDGSTEADPKEIVSQFADPRLHLERHSRNRGLAAARNTGFSAARAQLVLPLDADDRLDPRYLEVTVAALRARPDADCIFTDLRLFGEVESIQRYAVRCPGDMVDVPWIPGPGTLMHKRVWTLVGGYAEIPELYYGCEDWDFWIGAMEKGITPIHIPKPLYLYRRSPSCMTVRTLPYYDHIAREAMYRRHRAFFDRYHGGGRFRAEGYFRSATASLTRGKRLRAIWLSARGLLLDVRRLDLARVALIAATPQPCRPVGRRLAAALERKKAGHVDPGETSPRGP